VRRYTTHGTLLGRWGSAGRLSKYIPYPKGLAVDARGDVFLADTQTQTVDEFNAAGKLLERWYNLAPPNGAIATDSAGHVYLGNQASATVDMYSPGGHYMGSVGGPGRAVGSLRSIAALAVDSHGRVYVVDSDARAVSVLSPSGTLIARWTASRFPAFGHPRAITLDRGGNIYIGGDRQIVEVAALH
jgi:streptogramin lyase